ncbi:MAG: hypothetical protein F9K37_09545 [Bacteroidales bacterium]|nr:MAG: hypothetical protein F9K37_09545 [Bacteroidales bacterium]
MSESLPICKICKRNAADETGSHLLTAWLIASVYDESGRNRDYEIIFNMNEKFFRKPYFGRNILPDKIEDIIGKKKEEIDFKNQKHAFVENHIFCKHCEKRFKIIEDEFLNKIHRKLRLENFSILKNKKYSIQLIDNNLILRLFFYSQI